MKFFLAVLFVAVACYSANVLGAALHEAKPAQPENQQSAVGAESADAMENMRFRKSAYGGGSSGGYGGGSSGGYGGGSSGGYGGGSSSASIPAPPCPKNYLFSCQPSMVPVPCSAPQQSYQGAYSVPVPVIVKPLEQPLY